MSPSQEKGDKKNKRPTVSQLSKELAAAQNKLKQIEEELMITKEKFEKATSEIKIKRNKIKKYESKMSKMENKIDHLEKELDSEKQAEESITKDSTPKFCINFYPRQGHFNARIMNLLEPEKPKPIKESDKATIFSFISQYYPNLKEKIKTSEPEVTHHIKTTYPLEEQAAIAKMPHEEVIKLIPSDTSGHFNVIQSGQPFQIQIIVNPINMLGEQSAPLAYDVSIFAKRLDGGLRQTIGRVKGDIKSHDIFRTSTVASPLPAGTYRLEAVAIFDQVAGDPSQSSVFKCSSITNVRQAN